MFLNLGIVTFVDYENPQRETIPKSRDTVLYSMLPSFLESYLGLENISVAIKGSADARPTYQSKNAWYKPLESQFGYSLEEYQKAYPIEEEILSLGYESKSAGGVARELLEKAIYATYRRLPQGLQKEAHSHFSGLYQGPMILCRTGIVKSATYLDQDGAYLAAMLEPLPEFGRYPMRSDSPPEPEEILSGTWSVHGTFQTRYDYLPSLQRRSAKGNVWLNGHCQTKVAGNHLKYLLTSSKLLSQPTFSEAWEYDMEQRPSKAMLYIHTALMRMSKTLRKKVYTRLIGGLAHCRTFRYDGNVKELHRMAENGLLNEVGLAKADQLVFLPGSELPWKIDDIREYDFIPATYRPDIAWLIWERCTAETLRVCQKFGSNLLASHIDSCVVAGDIEPEKGWSVKAKGLYTGYGVGNYTIGEHVSCSGFDPEVRTLEQHFSLIKKDDGRYWPVSVVDSINPKLYTTDISEPFQGSDPNCKKFEITEDMSIDNYAPDIVQNIASETRYDILDVEKNGYDGILLSDGRKTTCTGMYFRPGRYYISYRMSIVKKDTWSGSEITPMIRPLTVEY